MPRLILFACLACVLLSGCATTRSTRQADAAPASQTAQAEESAPKKPAQPVRTAARVSAGVLLLPLVPFMLVLNVFDPIKC